MGAAALQGGMPAASAEETAHERHGSGKAPAARRMLVTGADGFLGRGLIAALARQPGLRQVVATDVREVPPERQLAGV